MSSWRPNKYAPSIRNSVDPYSVTKERHAAHRAELDRGQPEANAPPPPVIEDAAGRAQDEKDRLLRRRGRASSILNDGSAPMTASRVLLGA